MPPDSPEVVAAELRAIAEANTRDLGIKPQETVEWDAAAKLEVAARALREIRDGAHDVRAIAAIALLSLGG